MLVVDVTDNDIKTGKRGSRISCPIARAVRRVFPNSIISVWYTTIRVDDKVYIPDEPKKHELFVESFDEGGVVVPVSLRYKLVELGVTNSF